MSNKKTYLGDGAYAEIDERSDQIILTTEDGISVTNRIVLEPEVLISLLRFLHVHQSKALDLILNRARRPAGEIF